MNAHDFLVEIEDGKAAIIYELESLIERCRDIYFNETTCEFSVENRYYDSLVQALAVLNPEHELIRNSLSAQEIVHAKKILNSELPYRDQFKMALDNAMIEYSSARTAPLVQFPSLKSISLENPYTRKTVLFTGFYPEEKAQLHSIVELLNIQQKTDVSRKLDYLICGTNAGPSKIRKCEAWNIPVIQVKEFIQAIIKKDRITPDVSASFSGSTVILSCQLQTQDHNGKE